MRNAEQFNVTESAESNAILIDLMIKQREMFEVRARKLERDFDNFKRVVLHCFDHINQSNSELLNTLRSIKLDSPYQIVRRLESPSPHGDASRKRRRVVDTNEGSPDPDSIAIEASPGKSIEVASNLFTRTTTQKYTAIACLDDYLTFNLKVLSSWMDPNKSQKSTFVVSSQELQRFT